MIILQANVHQRLACWEKCGRNSPFDQSFPVCREEWRGRTLNVVIHLLTLIFQVCPANWTPDSPTIKPDPKGSLEYFDKVNWGCCRSNRLACMLVLWEGCAVQGVHITHQVLNMCNSFFCRKQLYTRISLLNIPKYKYFIGCWHVLRKMCHVHKFCIKTFQMCSCLKTLIIG